MTRYHLDWLPRCSWQPGVEACDQRWTRTPNIFTGTEEEATLECSDLEAAYDRSVIFRAVPIAPTAEEEAHHICAECGGDYRERIGHEYACRCPKALASTSGVRRVEEVAS